MNVRLVKPSQLSESELERIQTLIQQGNEVEFSSERLQRCRCIALVEHDSLIIACAAVKPVSLSYLRNVAEKADADLNPSTFAGEIGYLVADRAHRQTLVRPEMWRNGALSLLGAITSHLYAESLQLNLFATTRSDNNGVQAALRRAGFERAGGTWESERRAGVYLTLWTRTQIV